MRVVSGIYKRRRFEIPKSFKARPTTDFAKENLFNVLLSNYLNFEEPLKGLDLFSGTGSISIELVSRGFEQVFAVELDAAHYGFIQKIKHELKEERLIPIRGDVFSFIHKCKFTFDFIFADPPYNLEKLETLPDLIINKGLLNPEGLFVLEHGKTHHFETHRCFLEQRVYGSVHFSFFSIKGAEDSND